MIRCDHGGCRAPTSYDANKKPATFGPDPEWAHFIVGDHCYCGWHVEDHDPGALKRKHVTSITDPEEWKAHERRQAGNAA